jgi:hypothetical protein
MTIQPVSEQAAVIAPQLKEPVHRKYASGNLNLVMNEYPIAIPLVSPSSIDILASGKKSLYLKFASAHGSGRVRIEDVTTEGKYDIQEVEIVVLLSDGTQAGMARSDCKALISEITNANLAVNVNCPPSEQSGEFTFSEIVVNAEVEKP